MSNKAVSPIFILSLPRAGSTLLQRILSVHPLVSTTAEPWFLLPFFYALEPEGTFADYSHSGAQQALHEFIEKLPNGLPDYYQAINHASVALYQKISTGDTKYFIDKTPRYSLISKHILRAYPDAKIIFLWRNPLSILASINQPFGRGNWLPHAYKVDLYAGFERLCEAYREAGDRCISINYEKLVTDPEKEIRRICTYLEIPYMTGLIRDFSAEVLAGNFGDPTGVRNYATISSSPVHGWKKVLNTRFRVEWAKRYLSWIGNERMQETGYSLQELMEELNSLRRSGKMGISDLLWSIYGNATCYLESFLIRQKIRHVRNMDWTSIYKHS